MIDLKLVGKNYFMILLYIFVYLVSVTITLILLSVKQNKIFPLPVIEFKDKKICFVSHLRHKIFVGECKVLELNNKVFLKQNTKLIEIVNVAKIKQKNGWLYFNAKGNVQIDIGNKKWLRYAEMHISSNQFDLADLKQNAAKELMNNLFNIPACESLIRYLKFIKDVLKIELTDKGIKVKNNLYGLAFCLDYDFCGKQKHIIFNQSV